LYCSPGHLGFSLHLGLVLSLVTLWFAGALQAQERIKLKPDRWERIHVSEPSDICMSPDGQHYYIVSDDGALFKTDLSFNAVQRASKELYDPEGVYSDEMYVYVIEERTRSLTLFDHENLEPVRSLTFPYNGGRNKGYEAITFNEARNHLLLITEKEPVWVFELDADLRVYNRFEFKYKGDISAATYHNGKLWLLSDENMEVLKLNPLTYAIEHIYYVPVINPEGLVFLPDGRLLIISDDMARAYYFTLPDKQG